MNKTKVWTIRGIHSREESGKKYADKRKFEVYFNGDDNFKTLSICDIKSHVMFTIPFDKIFKEVAKNDTGRI